MIVKDRGFGQAEEAALAASSLPSGTSPSPLTYFFTAVAAGVTVFFITRWLGGRR